MRHPPAQRNSDAAHDSERRDAFARENDLAADGHPLRIVATHEKTGDGRTNRRIAEFEPDARSDLVFEVGTVVIREHRVEEHDDSHGAVVLLDRDQPHRRRDLADQSRLQGKTDRIAAAIFMRAKC